MIGFWDVYQRSEKGKFVKEQEFDRQVGTAANRLVQKHGIRFDPAEPDSRTLPVETPAGGKRAILTPWFKRFRPASRPPRRSDCIAFDWGRAAVLDRIGEFAAAGSSDTQP